MPKLSRDALANAALVVGSILTMIFIFEVGLRLLDGVPLTQVRNFTSDDIDQFQHIHTSTYDDTLGWRLKSDLRVARNVNKTPITETTDEDGFRVSGKHWPAPATGGILAVGDSFTYGTDVSDDQSWPAQLEDLIGQGAINAASQGWGTDQIVMRTENLIGRLRPATVVLVFLPHDIARSEHSIEFGAYKPYYTVESEGLVLHNVPVPHMSGTERELGPVRMVLGYSYALVWASRRLGLTWLGSNYEEGERGAPRGSGPQISCLLLQRLRGRLAEQRTKLILGRVYANEDFTRPRDANAIRVLECAQQLGYETVDTWDSFAAVYNADPAKFRSFWVYPEHWSHMSGAGNALVARAIADRLWQTGLAGHP